MVPYAIVSTALRCSDCGLTRCACRFAEYETLLDEPLKEIVEHLVHWRKARVVDVVSLKNIYGIKAGFKTDSLKSLSPKFAAAFPFLPPLVQLLSIIPPNAPFANVYMTPDSPTSTSASHRALYLSALIWLLLHEVLEKNSCYIRVVVSEEIKRGSRMSWTRRRMESGETGSAEDGSAGGTSDGAGPSAAGSTDRSTDRSPRRRRRALSSNGQPDDSSKMAIVPSSPITTTAMPSPVLLKFDPPILTEEGLPLSPSLMSKSARSMQSEFLMRLPKNRRGSNLATMSQTAAVGGGTSRTLSTFSSNSERPEEVDLLPSFILDPGRPSEVERRWLSEMCRDKDPAIVERFNKSVFRSFCEACLLTVAIQDGEDVQRCASPGRNATSSVAVEEGCADRSRRVRRALGVVPPSLVVSPSPRTVTSREMGTINHFFQSTLITTLPTPKLFPTPTPSPHTLSTDPPIASTRRVNSTSPPPTPKYILLHAIKHNDFSFVSIAPSSSVVE